MWITGATIVERGGIFTADADSLNENESVDDLRAVFVLVRDSLNDDASEEILVALKVLTFD